MLTTALVVLLAVYSALMTYLRATADKTETKLDDKLLAAGIKIESVVDYLKTKVPATKPLAK